MKGEWFYDDYPFIAAALLLMLCAGSPKLRKYAAYGFLGLAAVNMIFLGFTIAVGSKTTVQGSEKATVVQEHNVHERQK